ncbi:aromatic ring-hydroxylating dioxygenase subunit alpha [Marinobacter salinexigens]|uniref:Aromatic ring-hydroxylating dioxygenase subunit alpha n=1 Tax=Marinobacter salinexigens TaxID=2919747 RepID=A0A5B0VE16_9GAMM|nr:aromatic ring-hydroxylating dioxygenase subunit alpha [Marinobacter salinexigens]KAA1172877.1 aromatic ring-hydroxylating dioxygenase subunit alpha [Marinobacter salinexigens]
MNKIPEIERTLEPALLNDWHVVAASEEIVEGELTPSTLMERDLVIWRDSSGEVHVWEDLCIHRGARLSKGFIASDKVVCPYHGWNYDGTGRCTLIPASPNETPMKKARTIVHHSQEKYGLVWACIGTPEKDIPDFPEWNDATYKTVVCGPYPFKSAYRALENFIDPSHFPFVHAGVNGLMDSPDPIPPYKVWEEGGELFSSEVQVTQPYGDPREVPVISYYSYRVMRPCVAYFKKRLVITDPERAHEGRESDRFCTFFTAQQVDPEHSIIRITCAANFDPLPTDEDVRRRQDLVYQQDADIVDTQRPERIPVDLRAELHHSTDLLGMKYRAWMRQMGIEYGTV